MESALTANNKIKETSLSSPSLAERQTRVVGVLRCTVLTLLLVTASLVSTGVYLYTRNEEHRNFVTQFENSAFKVIESFHDLVEASLGAIDTMSISFTSFAIRENLTFPFVTLPDFELRGANLRIATGASVVHYMPVVTDEMRPKWEEYAMENRFHVNQAFMKDQYFRQKQDEEFDVEYRRQVQEQESTRNETIVEDGSGFHPKIWSSGGTSPRGDEPEGSGPYGPLWQLSPINPAQQKFLNLNFDRSRPLNRALTNIITYKKAFMSRAVVPIPEFAAQFEVNLRLGQYREEVAEYVEDPITFLAYPVFDSFDMDQREVVGIVGGTMYWKHLFSHILPSNSIGIICVIENSFNQTFAYRVDGSEATFIGTGDPHDPKYDNLETSEDVNSYLQSRARPLNRAYTTVAINEEVGRYKLRVYPSQDTENEFISNNPILYTLLVAGVFAFTSVVFVLYSCYVEKRQHLMMTTAVENAERAAATERELNEFLSHEVRNPLAAAMTACSFVSTAVNEPESLTNIETQKFLREDVEIIGSSLHFINDFLRSMLDIHQADLKQIKLHMTPTDVRNDVLAPVSIMVKRRDTNYELLVDCPENLIVLVDCLRLKQVVLNLVRNASKFVEHGFIRIRGDVVADCPTLFIEDSGPGIPLEKRKTLFAKFQTSLDSLGQGTGIGLCLSKNLMTAMKGDLWMDESYDSGVEGCPGARFVIELDSPRLELESSFFSVKPSMEDFMSAPDCSDLECVTHKDETPGTQAEEKKSDEKLHAKQFPENFSILFVDDDLILRKLFRRAVKKVDPSFIVQEAACGEIAVKLCESEHFHLIFVDQYMASVDKQLLGTDTIKVLRTKGVDSKLCGLSANDLKESFLNAGADYFMLKPMPCETEGLRRELLQMVGE